MINDYHTTIIKLTEKCNLNCMYCYENKQIYSSNIINKIIIYNILYKSIEYCNKSNRILICVWHGGEPLLAGYAFFNEILELQKNINKSFEVRIINKIQTNLSLLDNNFIKLFKDHNFVVGTSLDYPRGVHNSLRTSGPGNFDDVLTKINKLMSLNIPTEVTLVVNKMNVSLPFETYEFFNNQSINFRCNPIISNVPSKKQFDNLKITPEEYGKYLVALFNAWFKDSQRSIQISPLNAIMAAILHNHKGLTCQFLRNCSENIISIDPNGNISPCGKFHADQMCFGNITSMSTLEGISKSEGYKQVINRSQKVYDSCSKCVYYDLCYGGCMYHSIMYSGTIYNKDYYCCSYKSLFKEILINLSNLVLSKQFLVNDKRD